MPWNVVTQEWLDTPKGDDASPTRAHSPNQVRTEPCEPGQPPMEVALPPTSAASTSEYTLAVMRWMHLDSEVVTYLRPGTFVTPLTTCVLDDGTRRASISLQHVEGGGTNLPPSGWLTTEDLEGNARVHRYGRPVYEVAGTSLKVRRGAVRSERCLR